MRLIMELTNLKGNQGIVGKILPDLWTEMDCQILVYYKSYDLSISSRIVLVMFFYLKTTS